MYTLNCAGRLLSLDKPVVMGILNITPDSFYMNSRYQQADEMLLKAEAMLAAGAGILDIGGQSTRPGSEMVNAEIEMDRVIPAIELVHKQFPGAIISVDTFWSSVAAAAVAAGASIINDISAGSIDDAMYETAGKLKVPYVLMHMQGKPATMQQQPVYENVTMQVLDFFIRETGKLTSAGVNDIIADPGFGFGKTLAQNFRLLKDLPQFSVLGLPLMVGMSRKSMVTKTLNSQARDALNGTTVLNTMALLNGTRILRVHDVKEAFETIQLLEAYQQS